MIEQYIGHDEFRAGVRRYLEANAYGNAETTDLWDAIEAENPGVPLRAAMDSWVFQGGYPIVTVTGLAGDEGTVELRQEPFAYLPAETTKDPARPAQWLVPVIAAPARDRGKSTRVLLADAPLRIRLRGSPVVVNAGGSGFYRVRHDPALRAELLTHLEALDTVERLGLVGDLWAAVLAGMTELGEFLDAIAHLAGEDDPYIWSVVTSALRTVDLVAPDRERPLVARYTRTVLGPELARVGWEAKAGEGEQTPVLRSALIAALGTFGGDDDVRARARELFAGDVSGRRELDADIAESVLATVAWNARRSEFDALVARGRQPRSPLDERRHRTAFGYLTDPGVRGRGPRALPRRDPQPGRAVPARGDARTSARSDRSRGSSSRPMPTSSRRATPTTRSTGCSRGSRDSPSSATTVSPSTSTRCAASSPPGTPADCGASSTRSSSTSR